MFEMFKMEFKFDFIVPTQCSIDGTCGKPLLSVDQEFTKVGVLLVVSYSLFNKN